MKTSVFLVIKRALRRMIRQYRHSLVLFFTLLFLFTFFGASRVIDSAVNELETETKERLGAYVVVPKGETFNADKPSPLESYPAMKEMAELLAADGKQVKYYDLGVQATVRPEENESDILILSGVEQGPGLAFIEETVELVKGEGLSSKSGACSAVISVTVSERYKLEPGDLFPLKYWDPGTDTTSHCLEIEIAGIYRVRPNLLRDRDNPDYSDMVDQNIYMPNAFVYEQSLYHAVMFHYKDEIDSRGEGQTWQQWLDTLPAISRRVLDSGIHCSNLTFQLASIDMVAPFRAELQAIIGDNEIIVSTDKYERIAAGVINLQHLAYTVGVITLILLLLTIPLVLWIVMKDRKREFGIYMAIGERKTIIFFQALLETLIVATLAIGLSFVNSYYLSHYMSVSLLEELENSPDVQEPITWIDSVDAVKPADVLSGFAVAHSAKTVLSIYFIGSITVILGTMAPLVYYTSQRLRRLLL